MIRQVTIIFIAIVLLFTPVSFVYAQEVASAPAKVNYDLPYPGLLPDSPLYFLKAFRDQLQALFISNPMERAAFDLQLSDKRMEAGYILAVQKDKIDLAETTISKGENYFEDAIIRVQQAKKQGVNVTVLAKKMSLANKKHQEVIQNVEDNTSGSAKKKFAAELDRAVNLGKIVASLSK